MCGIIGYVGHQQAAPILLDGLARMEYRGYDSAGVAVRSETKGLQVYKSKGRLQVLSDMIHGGADVEGTLGIGHTRCTNNPLRIGLIPNSWANFWLVSTCSGVMG